MHQRNSQACSCSVTGSLLGHVGLSAPYDGRSHHWLLNGSNGSICLLIKTKHTSNYTANLYLEGGRVVVVYPLSFTHFSQLGAAGKNPSYLPLSTKSLPQTVPSQNNKLKVYLPLELRASYLCHAIREWNLSDMGTKCHSLLAGEAGQLLLLTQWAGVSVLTSSLFPPAVSKSAAPLWILSLLSYGPLHPAFLKGIPAPDSGRGACTSEQRKSFLCHTHTCEPGVIAYSILEAGLTWRGKRLREGEMERP